MTSIDNPTGRPQVTPTELAGHRVIAHAMRSDQLAALAVGVLDLNDVLDSAIHYEPALRRIHLAHLLIAQEGMGPAAAQRILTRMLDTLGMPQGPRWDWKTLTVSWLCDQRAGGRRYLAFKDAVSRESPRTMLLPRGFPYTSIILQPSASLTHATVNPAKVSPAAALPLSTLSQSQGLREGIIDDTSMSTYAERFGVWSHDVPVDPEIESDRDAPR